MVEKIKKRILTLSELTGEIFSCPLCGREIFRSDESGLCPECLGKLTFIGDGECIRCGRQLTDGYGVFCGECEGIFCEQIRCVTIYDDFSKRLVLGLKAEKQVYFAEIMGDFLFGKLSTLDWKADMVTAVPTYRKGKKYFNHSELIARRLCADSGLPFSSELLKIRKIEGQETRNYRQRLLNVKGVFGVNSDDFADKSVILVDDVRTSGATLNEAAKTLITEGNAARVYGLTFASTSFREPA